MRFSELPVARARMTSFNANRDVLISAPSSLVVRQAFDVSTPLSLPAKSMNVKRPKKSEVITSMSSKQIDVHN